MAAPDSRTAGRAWYLYLIECVDGSLYTGITVDVTQRFAAHAAGKGGHYTRSHPPKRIAAVIECADRSAASKAEHAVKRLTTAAKRELCRRHPPQT
ncbi:MAG: GIY-YIG nuclease family protein [Arenimonas sp.]|jgi:putative endonuclease